MNYAARAKWRLGYSLGNTKKRIGDLFWTIIGKSTRRGLPPRIEELIAGKVQAGKQPYLLGLGLWADEPNTIGRLTLELHQWLDVLRLRSQ